MHLKLFISSLMLLLITSCQQSPVPLGGAGTDFQTSQPSSAYPYEGQNQPQSEQVLTQRDGDTGNYRFSGFGENSYSQPSQYPSNIQRGGFNIFGGFGQNAETKVAFLVPLSGKFESLGKAMLNSANLAIFFLDEPNVSIMPIDTKGTPFGAKQAAEEAVSRGAKIILGPVFSRSAKSAITATEGSGVHIISFSNDKTLAETGVFTIGFRPELEVRRIISYALNAGIQDFTTVLPNSNYGATAAETVRLALEGKEASLLRSEIYYVDQKGQARNLYRHTVNAMDGALNSRAERDYIEEEKRYSDEPILYPRGMLVPEGGVRLKEILANLKRSKRFDAEKIRLLGSSLWAEESLEDELLNGAWFAAPDVNKHGAFEAHYKETYGKEAPSIASLAYDGVALAVALSRMSNGNDFSREAITNPRGFIGVDGIFRLEPDGLATRGLAVMEVQNGQAVVIDPAPLRFSEIENF